MNRAFVLRSWGEHNFEAMIKISGDDDRTVIEILEKVRKHVFSRRTRSASKRVIKASGNAATVKIEI